MKIVQTTVQKSFFVEVGGKNYYVDFIDSDKQNISLLKMDLWQITDQDHEELDLYLLGDSSKEEKKRVRKNWLIANKLIAFCMKHFNDYNPLKR